MPRTIEIEEASIFDIFDARDWGDGLPIVPPTPERVAAMLEGGGVAADELLGVIASRNRAVTADLVAVNAVMAGCRPDYFPIVIATVRAMLDPLWNAYGMLTSTGGSACCIVVSGPIARAVGMNARGNLLGPGFRANATIGRAARLVAMNIFGARPGDQDESSIATPAKFTFCFAEDEPAAPWKTLRDQLGYDAQDTTVTIMAAEGPRQLSSMTQGDPARLLRMLGSLAMTPGSVNVGRGGMCIVILGPEHQFVIRQAGWSQQQCCEFLADETRVTRDQLVAAGVPVENGTNLQFEAGQDGRYPVFRTADDIVLVTAGGHGAGWSAMIPSFAPSAHSRTVTKRVRPASEPTPDCGPDVCEIDLFAPVAQLAGDL